MTVLRICDHLLRRATHLDLCAHFLQARGQRFNLPVACRAIVASLFLHFADVLLGTR